MNTDCLPFVGIPEHLLFFFGSRSGFTFSCWPVFFHLGLQGVEFLNLENPSYCWDQSNTVPTRVWAYKCVNKSIDVNIWFDFFKHI
jgi:hypothetical protein